MIERDYRIDTEVLSQKMAMTEDSFPNYPVERIFSKSGFVFLTFLLSQKFCTIILFLR